MLQHKTTLLAFSIFITVFFFITMVCSAQTKKTIAILPFEMISNEDISYLQDGILQMLHSRLSWEDEVVVVKKQNIEMLLQTLDTTGENIISDVADRIHADYILTGSITQFSNAFSIDSKVYDISEKQYLWISEQSDKIDEIIPKVNVVAAKINYQVFDRETATYTNLSKKEKEKYERWKRQNPEKMLPQIPHEKKEKSQWWKIWKYL
jgi:TolB-like protein